MILDNVDDPGQLSIGGATNLHDLFDQLKSASAPTVKGVLQGQGSKPTQTGTVSTHAYTDTYRSRSRRAILRRGSKPAQTAHTSIVGRLAQRCRPLACTLCVCVLSSSADAVFVPETYDTASGLHPDTEAALVAKGTAGIKSTTLSREVPGPATNASNPVHSRTPIRHHARAPMHA